MPSFQYVIKDGLGIHARPAGMLAKEAKKFQSKIIITKGEKSIEATRVIALMSLAVKCGETINVSIFGPDDDAAAEAMKAFFTANL